MGAGSEPRASTSARYQAPCNEGAAGPEGIVMRSAGFPCRAGCERSFQVADQNSLDALQAASAERTAHEIAAHNYHHVRIEEEKPFSPNARITRPKPIR